MYFYKSVLLLFTTVGKKLKISYTSKLPTNFIARNRSGGEKNVIIIYLKDLLYLELR